MQPKAQGSVQNSTKGNKKVFIKTYGCQMNVYDSTRMMDVLHASGYELASTPDEADLAILNTCHIREKAAEKVFSELGRLHLVQKARRKANKARPLKLAVSGCVAQAEGDEIQRRAPYVSLVFGPQTYHMLPRFLAQIEEGDAAKDSAWDITANTEERLGNAVCDEGGHAAESVELSLRNKASFAPTRLAMLDFPEESKFDFLPEETLDKGPVSFLTVQEGCDKFCTYCVVPYTRGVEVSRPAGDIVAEAEKLVAGGAKELILLGQNVSAYHGAGFDGQEIGLGDLLHLVEEKLMPQGLKRLRYTTSHPRDTQDDLILAHRDLKTLMPFLHLPVQSGSNRVLKAMNRQHPREAYIETIARFRRARHDLALSSDFIVGFPGETEEDFQDTLSLVREIGYAQAYSFKYSPRPGTPGAMRDDQIEEHIKDERLQRLQALLNAQQLAFNESFVGQTLDVLIEKVANPQEGVSGANAKEEQYVGRSPYMQSVHFEGGSFCLGDIVSVRIEAGYANSLKGTLASKRSAA